MKALMCNFRSSLAFAFKIFFNSETLPHVCVATNQQQYDENENQKQVAKSLFVPIDGSTAASDSITRELNNGYTDILFSPLPWEMIYNLSKLLSLIIFNVTPGSFSNS